jgi:hypothetical protein
MLTRWPLPRGPADIPPLPAAPHARLAALAAVALALLVGLFAVASGARSADELAPVTVGCGAGLALLPVGLLLIWFPGAARRARRGFGRCGRGKRAGGGFR